MTLQVKHLYSETAGNRPPAEQVDVGQLWINMSDATIGTKKSDGQLATYAQLTEAEREAVRNAMPKTGQVSGVTVSQVAAATETDAATIDDNSSTVLEGTLTANEFHVTINKTTAHKNTKLVLKKPAGVTGSVRWDGVDLWLISDSAPAFGDTQEEQELAVAIFTSPTKVAVNVIYNTEHPVEIEATRGREWGEIEGTLSNQTDLQTVLDSKADKTQLASYATVKQLETAEENASNTLAPKANPQFTGGATIDGKAVATTDQIPDVSHFVTDTTLADYATTKAMTAEFESYDKKIKAHVESELGGYVTTTEYGVDKATFLTKSEASTTYATPANITQAISDLNISQYATDNELSTAVAGVNAEVAKKASLAGAAFTGSVTVQEPTAASNPATKQYVDNAVASVYKYKGSVANQAALPKSGQITGDVYNVEDTGDNFAWDGTKWDKLAGTVDLSAYLTTANASTTYLSKTEASTEYLGKTAKAASATTAESLSANRTISLTGDVTGSVATNLGSNASITTTLANSGATAGTYGPTAAVTLGFGGTVNVPSITVDAKGRVTESAHYAIKLPAAPTSVSGNAGTATRLQTARTIALSGAVTGTATSFDGSANITIPTTAVDGTKVSVFGAASADTAGTIGAVPAPAAGYQSRFLRGDGTWQTPTDNKMQQSASTADGNYPLLAKSTTATADINGQAIFDADTTINPSTGTITAKTFEGALSGNATTATTLATARTFTANLASTTAGSFNGSGNVTLGVTGTLPTSHGGTGRTDGKAINVTQVVTLSAVGPLGYTPSNGGYLTTSAAIAYWNGRYNGTSSNLQYCKTGAIIGSNGGTITGSLTVNGSLSGASLNATSDRRLKDVINTASGIDLSTLIPYRYTFKKDEKKDVHIGLIAQEVQEVVPEAVKVIDEEGHLGIEYNALVAILIDKVNQLERRCAQLEANLQSKATF